jgi:hypothetical protein
LLKQAAYNADHRLVVVDDEHVHGLVDRHPDLSLRDKGVGAAEVAGRWIITSYR